MMNNNEMSCYSDVEIKKPPSHPSPDVPMISSDQEVFPTRMPLVIVWVLSSQDTGPSHDYEIQKSAPAAIQPPAWNYRRVNHI